MRLSAIVIKAEKIDENLYKKCIDSISWCDETVVIPGIKGDFSKWRNEGVKKAKGEWLLYIDTDEEVTPKLKSEIEKVIKEGKYSAFAIPRRNFIFGKEMKHCGLWPDYVIRLIKKDKLISWKGELHEQPEYKGKLGYLKEPFIHRKHNDLSEMVEKTNKWSEIEAKLMFDAGHPKMNVIRFFSAGFREFWKRMIVQAAFLDGTEGVIYGLYQVFSRLISYSKLWEMQLNHARSNI